MDKFEIKLINDKNTIDEFVRNSPQGTIFSETIYLDACGRKYEVLGVFKGVHVKAVFVVILTDDALGCELDDLIIYGGILFKDDPVHKPVKALSERFQITELVIEYLDARFKKIELAFAPQFEDLRPFLWHNYHSKDVSIKFKMDLRYTSYIDISSLASDENEENTENFKNLDTLRKRNIREARKDGAVVKIESEIDVFIKFYSDLIEQQGEMVDQIKLNQMRTLIQALLDQKRAIFVTAYNPLGQIIYLTIFCFDSNRAYYLFGAGNPQATERYKGTICFWDAFRFLVKDYGVYSVDMEGVNSPQRGKFKLSFGGILTPYYQVNKESH